jgi:hypothetical protein
MLFPNFGYKHLDRKERKSFQPDEKHAYAFDFVTLEKRTDKCRILRYFHQKHISQGYDCYCRFSYKYSRMY